MGVENVYTEEPGQLMSGLRFYEKTRKRSADKVSICPR